MSSDDTLTESSGNVFADLGMSDSQDVMVKAQLAHAISALVRERGLTQGQAAEVLGIDQPKVSALTRGRLDGFSVERLLRFLLALDRDIQIVVTPKRDALTDTRVTVVTGL